MDLVRLEKLPSAEAHHEHELNSALVRELMRRVVGALLALLPALLLLWHLIRPYAGHLRPWFIAVVALTVVRLAVTEVWLRQPPERFPPVAAWAGVAVGSALLGGGLAVILALSYPLLPVGHQALLLVTLVVVISGAMVSMASSPTVFWVYSLPMLGVLGNQLVTRPPPGLDVESPLLFALYVIALVVMTRNLHRSLRSNVLLGLRLRDLALHDSLTGLRNRRFLMETMPGEVERVQRSWCARGGRDGGVTLGVLIVDLDHFKSVNDRYGHAAGDAVLRQVADILRGLVRKGDLVVRWGGEEFVVIARDVKRRRPLKLVERALAGIERHDFQLPSGEVIRCTASIGYSLYPFLPGEPDALTWQQVLDLADGALYEAKRGGRNCARGVTPGAAADPIVLGTISDGRNELPQAIAGGQAVLV